MHAVDVVALLDEGRLSRYQKGLIAATALAVVLDGADNQLLPNAIPSMMAEWAQPRAAFANAAAAAPFGAMLGGVLGGMLGDRVGRQRALSGSVLAFGLLTLAMAFVHDLGPLLVLRALAGIGLGAAMPNAAALVAECAPSRQRPMAIAFTIVCIPLGGTLAGLLAAQIIPAVGWRALFLIGGGVPLLVAAFLFAWLPESPRFLVARRARWPELRSMLRRCGHAMADDVSFVESHDPRMPASGEVWRLFAPDLRRDTLGLVGAFCCCLLAIFIGLLWIPAMLTDPQVGFSQPQAGYALSLFNFGGVAGALLGAAAMQRLGSRLALLGMSALGVLCSLAMARVPLDPQAPFAALAMFTVTGGLLNAVQTTMYALAAHVYPTAIRGTGVGTTVAIGRIGNVLASYVGSWALTRGGPPVYFTTWAMAMTIVFLCLAIIRRHIPRPRASGERSEAPAAAPRDVSLPRGSGARATRDV